MSVTGSSRTPRSISMPQISDDGMFVHHLLLNGLCPIDTGKPGILQPTLFSMPQISDDGMFIAQLRARNNDL